jgi:hypothetical protein
VLAAHAFYRVLVIPHERALETCRLADRIPRAHAHWRGDLDHAQWVEKKRGAIKILLQA